MNLQLTKDHTFQVILNFMTPNSAGGADVRTSILIFKADTFPCILSASHVAKGCGRNTEIAISNQNGDKHSISTTRLNSIMSGWVHHHPVAAVSALRLNPGPYVGGILNGRFLLLTNYI